MHEDMKRKTFKWLKALTYEKLSNAEKRSSSQYISLSIVMIDASNLPVSFTAV